MAVDLTHFEAQNITITVVVLAAPMIQVHPGENFAVVGIPFDGFVDLPNNYDGMVVNRRLSGAVLWTDITADNPWRRGMTRIDTVAAGTYDYRIRYRDTSNNLSAWSSTVTVVIAGVADLTSAPGAHGVGLALSPNLEVMRFQAAQLPAVGVLHSRIAAGSTAGSTETGGIWLDDPTWDTIPPYLYNEEPPRNSTQTPGVIDEILFFLADLPDPGFSGIDDTYTRIYLSTTSQLGGAAVLVWEAQTSQIADLPTTVVPNGADPDRRDVRILMPLSYLGSEDTVTVTVNLRDLAQNTAVETYSFTMAATADEVPPDLTWSQPICDTDDVAPDTEIIFDVTDAGSGVDQLSIQVYVQVGDTAEIQVLQDGQTFLQNYSGSVVAIPNGYRVTVRRPASDPLWPAGEQICVRVEACDLAGGYGVYALGRDTVSS